MSDPCPFPAGFFDRDDPSPDDRFYAPTRLVTHIDDAAIAAVTALYAELGLDGATGRSLRVLDLMSSWVSHLASAPTELVVLGMNATELDANPMATERIVADLNVDPALPLADASVDAVLCCVSVDYLTRPVEVLAEVARVLRPGAPVVVTFSNRCFPTKAIRGWLSTDDVTHCAIVVEYLRLAGGFGEADVSLRTPDGGYRGDPLYAVVRGGCPDGSSRGGALVRVMWMTRGGARSMFPQSADRPGPVADSRLRDPRASLRRPGR